MTNLLLQKKNDLPEIEKRNITSDKIISQMKIKDSKNNQKESHLIPLLIKSAIFLGLNDSSKFK